MNGDNCLSGVCMDTVVRACKQLLRKGSLSLILFSAALLPAFASSVEIGTMYVDRSCNSAGVQLCTGTVVVLNEMENFAMVDISFTVGPSSYSELPPQVIVEGEAVDVENQGGVNYYQNIHGLTLLSVSGRLGGISAPPLTFITPAGTFTASSDNWTSPQFQANFEGSLGIFVDATPVSPTTATTPEPSTLGLMAAAVIGLLCVIRKPNLDQLVIR